MDCEKQRGLQLTSDVEPLISDSFFMQGQLTDLYLYPSQLKIQQKNKVHTIPIDFNLTFAFIITKSGPVGIEFKNQKERISLRRDFWTRSEQWERVLLSCITRQDFHDFFKPIKKIGKGNFASVYLAQDLKKNRQVAIKAFMKEIAFKGEGKLAIENEIKIMRRVNSKGVVRLFGVYETKNSLYLSMEYLHGMTLENYLRKNQHVPLNNRIKILKALLVGLKDLKELGIVHRDLKPENIIVSAELESIKIIDFGLATSIDQPKYIFVRCGTPGFIAPEILQIKDLANARLGTESDMFSVGAIYYRMLYGKHMFPGNNQNEVLLSNRHCRIRLAQVQDAGYGEIQLLRAMLEDDPFLRITPARALQSAFLREKKQPSLRQALRSIENIELTSSWTSLSG